MQHPPILKDTKIISSLKQLTVDTPLPSLIRIELSGTCEAPAVWVNHGGISSRFRYMARHSKLPGVVELLSEISTKYKPVRASITRNKPFVLSRTHIVLYAFRLNGDYMFSYMVFGKYFENEWIFRITKEMWEQSENSLQ